MNCGGNIAWDSNFISDVDPNTVPNTCGNLRLLKSSPSVEVGDNALIAGALTDLDREHSIVDGGDDYVADVDMGSFE